MIISGYASVFNLKDELGDIVLQNAFRTQKWEDIPILWQHDKNKKIGKILFAKKDSFGFFVKAKILDNYESLKLGVESKILNGFLGFSIGFIVDRAFFDKRTETRYIDRLKLLEVSIVSKPANRESKITSIF